MNITRRPPLRVTGSERQGWTRGYALYIPTRDCLELLVYLNYGFNITGHSRPQRRGRRNIPCAALSRVLRLWSIRIGRDHNRDGQPNVHEVQDKDAASCAANRELKRAVNLGREEKWRKRRRHALLVVLAAVRRNNWAYAVGFRPRVREAVLNSGQGARLRFRSSSPRWRG